MNTGINLLPWREERQRLQQRRTIIGSAVIGVAAAVFVAAVWWYFSEEIAFQKQRNRYLSSEIKKTEAQLLEIDKIKERKEELINRMTVIYDLQEDRVRVVRSLDEFVIEGITTTIELHKKLLTHKKFIDSNFNVSWLDNEKII